MNEVLCFIYYVNLVLFKNIKMKLISIMYIKGVFILCTSIVLCTPVSPVVQIHIPLL